MKQITIITENQPGVIVDISAALAAENINIESLDAESLEDSAIILLTVDRYDDALHIINNFPQMKAVTEDVLLVRIDDKPGAVAHIAKRFYDAKVDIRSIRIIRRDEKQSLAAICATHRDEAMALVKDILVS